MIPGTDEGVGGTPQETSSNSAGANSAAINNESHHLTTLIGEQLGGQYEIIEALGYGASSVVYKSVRVADGKFFAIKLLHLYLVDKLDTLKRFEQEARAVMLLSHPNISKIHAINKSSDAQPYLVLDYVEGTSLAQLIIQLKGDIPRSLKLFIQIADAMNHAHVHGVVHRSLKPGNVIVTTDGAGNEHAIVCDFGLAKLLPISGKEIQNLTQKGAVIGTPLFMSPEQCLGREIDNRADIYSMGCLMYACVSGKPPLKGGNILDTISKHVREIPLTFDKVCPELKISPDLQSIIFKCMAKRLEDRYQTMELLKTDLLRIQEGKSPQSAQSVTPSTQQEKSDKSESLLEDDRLLKVGLLAILLLLLGLVVYAAWKGPQYKSPDEVKLGRPAAKNALRTVHPISPLAMLKQADELGQMHRDAEAQALYREAILKAQHKDNDEPSLNNEVMATAHFGLAGIYRRTFHWSDAEKELRLALYAQGLCPTDAAPGKERLQLELVDTLMHQGKLDESKQFLLDFLKDTKAAEARARIYLMLSDIARASKNAAEAEQYQLAALSILKGLNGISRRDYCSVLSRFANGLIAQKKYKQCISRLKEAIAEHPVSEWDENDVDLAVFLTVEVSRAYACTGDYKAALDICKSTMQSVADSNFHSEKIGVNSANTEILGDTAAVLTAMAGDAMAAERSLGDDLAPDGERLGRAATIARIMIFNKQAEEAIKWLDKFKSEASQQAPSKAEFHALMSLALSAEGLNDNALKEIDLAISTLEGTSEESLHLYCLQVKCKILRQLKRSDAAEVIEKSIGKQDKASEAFDFLLPAYQRGGI